MKICIIIDTIKRKSFFFFLFEKTIFNEINNEIGEFWKFVQSLLVELLLGNQDQRSQDHRSNFARL